MHSAAIQWAQDAETAILIQSYSVKGDFVAWELENWQLRFSTTTL